MERLVASSDLWPDITVTVGDADITYAIGLELTYGFDPTSRRMAVSVCGLRHGGDPADRTAWREVALMTDNASIIAVFVSNLTTAQRLTAEIGLPASASYQVRTHLEEMSLALDSFVKDAFLGRTLLPETPQATAAPAPATSRHDNVLITVDRDVSKIFGRKEGSCFLEYTLFSEPKAFRAVIVAHRDEHSKRAEFIKKDPNEIIRHLNGDALAFEIASYFGDADTHKVYLIGAVLKLGFGMNTGLAKEASRAKLTPTVPTPLQETVALPKVTPEKVMMFSQGEYRELPG